MGSTRAFVLFVVYRSNQEQTITYCVGLDLGTNPIRGNIIYADKSRTRND